REYFDHKNPEGELITEQMKKDGVTYEAWAENIDYIQGNFSNSILADNFMNNWMKSEEHRENILSKEFTSIGIGVYKIGNKYYATQQFHK
ncbi:MAG: CAP domain-containing protein, partial [Clostridium sp.]